MNTEQQAIYFFIGSNEFDYFIANGKKKNTNCEKRA